MVWAIFRASSALAKGVQAAVPNEHGDGDLGQLLIEVLFAGGAAAAHVALDRHSELLFGPAHQDLGMFFVVGSPAGKRWGFWVGQFSIQAIFSKAS